MSRLGGFLRKIGLFRPAPWIQKGPPPIWVYGITKPRGSQPLILGWVNLDGGKNTSQSVPWIWWVNQEIQSSHGFFWEKKQTKRRRRWMCKAPEFFFNHPMVAMLSLKDGNIYGMSILLAWFFYNFSVTGSRGLVFHMDFLRKHNVWMELARQMFPKIGVRAPKSSFLVGCFIINHPFWGTPNFGNTHLLMH